MSGRGPVIGSAGAAQQLSKPFRHAQSRGHARKSCSLNRARRHGGREPERPVRGQLSGETPRGDESGKEDVPGAGRVHHRRGRHGGVDLGRSRPERHSPAFSGGQHQRCVRGEVAKLGDPLPGLEVVDASADDVGSSKDRTRSGGDPANPAVVGELAEHPLPARAHQGLGWQSRRPLVADLARYRHQKPCPGLRPILGECVQGNPIALRQPPLTAMTVEFDVLEHGPVGKRKTPEIGAGILDHRQLRGTVREAIHTYQAANPQSQPSRGKRAVRCGAAEPPTTTVVGSHVARGGSNYDQIERTVPRRHGGDAL